MNSTTTRVLLGTLILLATALAGLHLDGAQAAAQSPAAAAARPLDLATALSAGRLRSTNRTFTRLEGRSDGVKVGAGAGPGVVWIEGTDFSLGTIEADVRGRDALNASYLGIAFHRRDEQTYEDLYLRPFNFRATDPMRHQHAIQYEAMPENPWAVLRAKFPEEFENPVEASVDPNDWVALRVVVTADRVQAFAGRVTTPTLEVRRLAQHNQGQIGLWVGNTSEGDFANLRVTPAK